MPQPPGRACGDGAALGRGVCRAHATQAAAHGPAARRGRRRRRRQRRLAERHCGRPRGGRRACRHTAPLHACDACVSARSVGCALTTRASPRKLLWGPALQHSGTSTGRSDGREGRSVRRGRHALPGVAAPTATAAAGQAASGAEAAFGRLRAHPRGAHMRPPAAGRGRRRRAVPPRAESAPGPGPQAQRRRSISHRPNACTSTAVCTAAGTIPAVAS